MRLKFWISAAALLVVVTFGLGVELHRAAHESSAKATHVSRARGADFAARRADSLGSLPNLFHLDLATAERVGSFTVPDLGHLDVYRVYTADGAKECLLDVGAPFDSISCLDGSLFKLHRAAIGVIGVAGTAAAPARELIVGVVAPGVNHVDLVTPHGQRHSVATNGHGAFAFAAPAGAQREDLPARVALLDEHNRVLEDLPVGQR